MDNHVIGPKVLDKNLNKFQKSENLIFATNDFDCFIEEINEENQNIKEEFSKIEKSEERRDSYGNIILKGNKNHKIAFRSQECIFTVPNLKQFNKKNTIKMSNRCIIF